MKLFKDKELEARMVRIEELIESQEKMIGKLLKRLPKTKSITTDSEKDRAERMEKSFQKLMSYNEDIAIGGYKK